MKKVSREFQIRKIKDLQQFVKVTREHGLEFPVSEDVKALGEPIRLQSGKVIPNSMGIHSFEGQPEPLHGQHVRRGLCVASA